MAEKTEVKSPPIPEWFSEGVVARFRAGISSVFILHGDVTCLVPNPRADAELRFPYIPLTELFARTFGKRDMVIFYDIATGMRFLTPEMEKEFRKVAEIAGEDDDAPKDPIAAAKAGLAAKRALPREPELCLPLIEKALKKMDSVAVIIESAHFIVPESSGNGLLGNERTHIARLRVWAQDSRVKNRNNIVLLLTDLASKVSGELRQSASRIATVFVPKPTPEERKLYIERQTKGIPQEQEIETRLIGLRKKLVRAKEEVREEIEDEIAELEEELKKFPTHFEVPKDFDIDVFVNATQGMSLRQILEIFRAATQAKRTIDLSLVKEKKKEILNAEYGDVMEVLDPDWGLDDIGGLEYLKGYFREIIDAIGKGLISAIPQGITLSGPPGTGKTAIVEALAKACGYTFVKMKNARSMWVGMSEERTERQIKGLWALAPVIVMNDEADLGEANRDAPKGDSGVSERIMQAWMQFLADPKIHGKILVINCTNRPDRMDAAMKRSGRSDDRPAMLRAPRDERVPIFKVMFRKYKIATSITDLEPYADLIGDMSGADIRKIVLDADNYARRNGKKCVDDESLRYAVDDFIPSASQKEIDFMTLVAISECSHRRLLPPHTRETLLAIRRRNLVPEGADLIAQIEARNIVKLDEVL